MVNLLPARRPRRTCCVGCLLVVAVPLVLLIRGLAEPRMVEVTHSTVLIADLPPALAGLRIAVLTDIHHGPWLSRKRVTKFVELTNCQQPDVIVILGDVVHRDPRYIGPVWEELGHLRAPLGVYAVLGNHDYWEGATEARQAMTAAGIVDLTQQAAPLKRNGQWIWLVGVDDLWDGQPDLPAAMQSVGPQDIALVMTHNPDAFMRWHDLRARVWLAGHTHGGQVVLPWFMKPIVPSKYGQKLRAGWFERHNCRIYVSRGLGCITPPLRLNCRPELPILELRRSP